jgi:hypothetical protein
MTILVFDVETKNDTIGVAKRMCLTREGDAFNYPHLMEFAIGVLWDDSLQEYKQFNSAKDMCKYILSRPEPLLVSYNGKRFDIPSMFNHLDIDTINQMIALPHIDMLQIFYKRVNHRFRVSLDNLAKNTLGISKSGNGADAPKMFQDKRFDELFAYCQQDVNVTKQLFNYLKENMKWSYFDSQTGTKEEMMFDGKEIFNSDM